MNYNAVISAIPTGSESGEIPLVVSLEEMKNYLRLQGFVDSDESPSTDLGNFDFDDDLITEMIYGSQELISEKAGISLYPREMEAVLINLCGMIEIPFGPVISITSLVDSVGALLTPVVIGNHWKFLESPCQKNMTMIYEAGYVDLPKAIKLDVMRLAAYLYENRGEQSEQKFASTSDEFVFQLVSKYSRMTGII